MRQIEAEKGVDYHVIDRPLDPSPETIDDEAPRSRIGQYILGGSVAVILTALATSVFAGPVKTIDIGVYVEMVGVDTGYVIEYHNDISHTGNPPPFTLSLDDVEVGVVLELTTGDNPDYISVAPPVGWYCDPCSISVKEREIGQVFLYPQGLSWDKDFGLSPSSSVLLRS